MTSAGRRGATLAHRTAASAARRPVLAAGDAPPGPKGDARGGPEEPGPPRSDALGPEDLGRPEAGDGALGRHADRPEDIPPRGWRAVLRRVIGEAISDEAGTAAASCGFYALLALFPALSVAVSLYGLFADPATVAGQLEAVRDVLPPSTYELVATRIHDLAAAGRTELTWGLALSLPVALWSAMSGTKSILNALNVAYEEREKRSLLRLNLVALLFTLGGMAGTALALAVVVGVPAALPFTWLGPLASAAVRACSFALLLGSTVLGLAVLYRFAPSREKAKWRWVTPGALLAAGLWLLASLAFSFYVSNFGSYDVRGAKGRAVRRALSGA